MTKKIRVRKVPATTNNLTKAIVNFLLAEGHSASRINTQGNYRKDKKAWTRSGARVGVSDILACFAPHGKFVAIEVKTGSDKIRKEQSEFVQEISRAGGLYIIAKDWKMFFDWYRSSVYGGSVRESTMQLFSPWPIYTPVDLSGAVKRKKNKK